MNWTRHTRKQILRNKPDRNQNKKRNRTYIEARDLEDQKSQNILMDKLTSNDE